MVDPNKAVPRGKSHRKLKDEGVWNKWNGMVEWNAGMEYWNKRSITQYIKQDKHMYQHAYLVYSVTTYIMHHTFRL